MSSQSDIKKSIDNAVNNIYPDVSEKSINNSNNIEKSNTDLNISDYKEKNYTSMWIIGIIIVIILFFIIWIIAYNYSGNTLNTEDDITTNNPEYNTNIGAMIQDNEYYLIASKSIKKMKNKYQLIKFKNEECNYGYYGENCNLQAHSIRYYNPGSFNSTYKSEISFLEKTLSLNYDVQDGSKDETSCTSICDFRIDCKGVIYNHENSTCSLITSDIIATGEAKMDYTKCEQMYLKRSIQPKFTDLIIGFTGSKIMRYYLNNISSESYIKKKRKLKNGIIHFIPEIVIKTTWNPYRIINYGGYVGLYSNIEFTINNWKEIEMLYIDRSIGEYNIPLFLQEYTNLYVLYIKNTEYNLV